MKNRKRIKTFLIAAVAVAGVGGVGAAGIHYFRTNSGKTVEVMPVSSLSISDLGMGSDDSTSGTVVSNVSQSVRIPDGKVIDKVYVNEGDKVKIGDKLLSYDTTLLELDKELQEITVMELGLEVKAAEADLAKLKNTRPGDPIPDMESNTSDSYLDGDSDYEPEDDDGDEEARLIGNERELLAVQENGSEPESQEEVQETGQTENSSEVSAPQTMEESDKESEVVIDQPENVVNEVLTPDDLNGAGNSGDSAEAGRETDSEGEQEKAKHNQSLKEMFTNVRVKAVTEEGEVLLADIRPGEEATVELSGDVKVIPHFSEGEVHFSSGNTYTMFLHGVTLKEEITGKVYGIARINGEDYPEIGGFTLVQKKESDDTALLILAFHDGLDQQHEEYPELEDMYVEIMLEEQEFTGDGLVLRTEENEEDAAVSWIKTQPETESEPESEEEILTEEAEEEKNLSAEQESQMLSDESEQSEPESQSESESESETESEIVEGGEFPLQKIRFLINWDHGENSKQSRPSSMKVYYYQNGIQEQDDPDYSFILSPGSSVIVGTDSGIDGTDSQIDEEASTEIPTEVSSENDTENESESETQSEADFPAEVITEEEEFSSEESWKAIELSLPESSKWMSSQLGDNKARWNELWSGFASNYSMTVEDVDTDRADSSATVVISMKYIRPAESPLLKLNPISELTYQHGLNTLSGTGMRAYKGSGTAEDPYVFFVTDGVKITNTFVNWVLGFDEEGVERVSDGYYIRLEIRESDTITGAFIRSIDLDGTVLTEQGYGPGTYWIFNSETGITKYEEEITDDPFGPDTPGGGWGNDNDGMHYTAEELAQLIEEKELELKKLKLDEREAELKLKNYNKQLKESTVVSSVDGYVKSINGSEDDAYMVVDSENGMYVKTSVSELKLDEVAVNQVIRCESYYTGSVFTATITEVSSFPSSESGSDIYSGNVNSSSYPVLAVVDQETADSLSEYEDVSVSYPTTEITDGDSIFLEKAYIRSENGQSYVYIADENQKLKKQYVRTGETMWGYVKIRQGLSNDDQIAFPYGKTVKEGAAVKLADGYE